MKTRLVMNMSTFREMHDWCRQLYVITFGEAEGRTRFNKLTLLRAIDLWKEGGGLPLTRTDERRETIH